ncbi:hypothetical protein [Aliiroseovarius lamellibrachiae]|uniref:hypothetical protein n=1 Tax=Aliiroseovarius lamellibrachiae TaxID=1924933 RepID=UPI001BE0B8CE|nr:hypothetical protein [Aliiroseovarius lamellibrachiae]
MTSIAEYFRDLAADDRYFGAEPPTPDADMLHRIAEREIQKRVEARVEDDGVVLRQADSEPSTQTAVGATLVAADHLLASEHDLPDAEEMPTAQELSQDAVAQDIAAEAPVAEGMQIVDRIADAGDDLSPAVPLAGDTPDAPHAPERDSIADKLQRIRAVVDEKRAEGEAAFVAADQYTEDQNAAELFDDGDDLEPIDTDAAPEDAALEIETASTEASQEDASSKEHSAVDTLEDVDAFEDDAATDLNAGDTHADAPQEDTTKAAENAAPEAPTLGVPPSKSTDARFVYSEAPVVDDTAKDAATSTSDEVEQGAEDLVQVASETDEDTPENTPENADVEDLENGEGADTISGILSRLQSTDAPAEPVDQDLPAEDVDHADAPTSVETASDDLNAETSALASLVNSTLGDEQPSETSVENAENIFTDEAEKTAPEAPQNVAEPETEEASTPPRKPRVIRVRHIKGAQPETAPAPQAAPASQDNENSMLTPEDEAELMAELAAAEEQARIETDDAAPEAETAQVDETSEAVSEIDELASELAKIEDTTDAPRLTAFDDSGVGKSDAALDRILAETNTQMESTEVTRRRTSIAHLKAAVMATRADEETKNDLAEGKDTDSVDPYRNDLARVVRPRRPGKPDTQARRMPPLVLVSEQRIDDASKIAEPATQTAEAVRPRRVVRSAQIAQEMDDTSQDKAAPGDPVFAGYVEETGAKEMGELLEAAACHTVLIKGNETFTRPQVMSIVRKYQGFDVFSREEGLRAFGKLLREGRIKRLKRGQFELTDTTRFRPDDTSGDRPDDRRMA